MTGKKIWKIGETQNVKIADLKRGYNPRQDFSHVPALADNIRDNGQTDPIIANLNGDVIDGESRIRAMELLKRPDIDATFRDMDAKEAEEYQLMIFQSRKQLNPLEEAEAFTHYLDKHKATSQQLAKKIGKKADYVERRLALSGLTKESKKALEKKEIRLGHAVLLSRMDPKKQKKLLNDAKTESVESFIDDFRYIEDVTENLIGAAFDKKDCKDCKYNGGSQTLLSDLDGDGDPMTDQCMDPKCFRKKQKAAIQAKAESLKKEGCNVLTKEEVFDLPFHPHIQSWETSKLATAKKNRAKKPDTYAVVIDSNGDEDYYHIKKPKAKATDVSEDSSSPNQSANQLQQKIKLFKHKFLSEKCEEYTKQDTVQASVLTLLALDVYNDEIEGIDYVRAEEKKLYKIPLEKLNAVVLNAAKAHLTHMDNEELMFFGKEVGLNLKKDFIITEEYLDLHTKDQIIALAKELTLPLEIRDNLNKGGKKDMIKLFLTAKLTGLVPKQMEIEE